MLGAGARDAERVSFLKRVTADQLGGNLPGDCDYRNRVHQRIHQRRYQVGGAGAGSRAAYADFSGRARVAFRGKTGVLFMTYQDVLNLMIVERVVKGQRHAARIAEEALD